MWGFGMNIFEDKINGIMWYNAKKCLDGEYMAEDLAICNEVVKEINTWMSPNIERFITDENLGSFMLEESWGSGYEDFFFGLVDGKLATSIVLAKEHGLPTRDLINHMFSAAKRDIRDLEVEKMLSFDDTRQIIDDYNAGKKSVYLNFLVVNPYMQNRGIGTNSLRSLDSNIHYFVDNGDYSCMYATINENNVASRRVFNKNNYLGLLKDDKGDIRRYPFDDYFKVM